MCALHHIAGDTSAKQESVYKHRKSNPGDVTRHQEIHWHRENICRESEAGLSE